MEQGTGRNWSSCLSDPASIQAMDTPLFRDHSLICKDKLWRGDMQCCACKILRVAELAGPLGSANPSPLFYSRGNRTPKFRNCPTVTQSINGRAQMGILRPQFGPEEQAEWKNRHRSLHGPLGPGVWALSMETTRQGVISSLPCACCAGCNTLPRAGPGGVFIEELLLGSVTEAHGCGDRLREAES